MNTLRLSKNLTGKFTLIQFIEGGTVEPTIEVTVTVGERQITLKGPEGFVRAEVQRLTNAVAAGAANFGKFAAADAPPTQILPTTERAFIAHKKPRGHSEIVATLGFFLSKNGQPEFTPEDIRRAYARAGIRPPKVIAQALRDAKNLNDYLEQGEERGTFRLSPHGERTVEFDLPRKDEG